MSTVVAQNESLVRFIRESKNILVFTGAGISTSSGIPDLRGRTAFGLGANRSITGVHEIGSARVEHWDNKLDGWAAFRDARPNATHDAVVRLERAGKLLMVVTQNINGLHHLAGTSIERLVELHGTNSLVECQTCGEMSDPSPHFEFFHKTRRPPVCECGGFLKPATISFGQEYHVSTNAE